MRLNISAATVIVLMTLTLSAAEAPVAQVEQMSARFAAVNLKVDTSKLSAGDRAALQKLVVAARRINHIFLQQMWNGNLALYDKLRQDKSGAATVRFDYFWLNKGP